MERGSLRPSDGVISDEGSVYNQAHGCELLQQKIQSKMTKGKQYMGWSPGRPRHKWPQIFSQWSRIGYA